MLMTMLMSIALANPTSAIEIFTETSRATVVSQVAKVHAGKVVSVADGKLVAADKDGKNQINYMITPTAKIMLDGKTVKLTDLKAGDAIKVTTAEGVVTVVDATRVAALTQ